MADFPPLLASSIFDLYKQETPQIKSQTMRHDCGPIIENEHLWVCTRFMFLYIPISLNKTFLFVSIVRMFMIIS